MREIISIHTWSSRWLAVVAVVGSTSLASSALAQSQATQVTGETPDGQQTSASARSVEEVVVTARRREERLADVPVSVTALSAEALDEQRILTEADLQAATPGLSVRQTSSSNQTNFAIRGQSLDAFSFASPAVLTYFNEFNAQGVSASSFFDLESIQVLKGPQGTLFGRNATGGAVLLQPRKPELGETGGYLRASYGNFEDTLAEGAVNLPLGESVALRIGGQYQKRDGYQRNVLLDEEQASLDNLTLRGSVRFTAGSGLDNVTTAQYGRYQGNSAGTRLYSAYDVNETRPGGVTTLSPAIPSATLYGDNPAVRNSRIPELGFSGLFDFEEDLKSKDFYDIYNNQDGRHRAEQDLVTNVTTWQLNDTLVLKNVAGYNNVESRDRTDIDGTPYVPLDIGHAGDNTSEGYTYEDRQASEEIQLSGNLSDRLDFIAGLYYLYAYSAQTIPLAVAPDLISGPLSVFRRTYETRNNSTAVYAQGTYSITDDLKLTVGGRYTWEIGKFNPRAGDANALLGVTAAERKDDRPSWTISLDYKVTPDLLFYVAHRGSWRTGGFNGTAADFNPDGSVKGVNQFEPETTYDFEVGAKFSGELVGMPASANLAIYDQYVEDVIRAIYIGVSAVSGNVKEARITGAEFDVSLEPVSWLQLGANVAYTDARYTDPAGSVVGQNFPFGPFADAPKWQGSVYFRTEHDLSVGQLVMRGDYYAQSSFFYTNAAGSILPDTELPSYDLVGGRVELNEIAGSNISAAAYIRNAMDEEYYVGGFGLGAVIGINSALPGTPRLYGLEIRAKF